MQYYNELVQIDEFTYEIRNEDQEGEHLRITIDKDEEDESIDIEGFDPRPDLGVLFANMFSEQQQYNDPHQCLYLFVESLKSMRAGMRSEEELA